MSKVTLKLHIDVLDVAQLFTGYSVYKQKIQIF